MKRIALAAALVMTALAAGLLIDRYGGDRVADAIMPTSSSIDPRLVVVAFGGSSDRFSPVEASYRRATYYRDIATIASEHGARAVGFVDFDSVGFSDGAGGRANVVASPALQEFGVNELLDASLKPTQGQLPLLTRYRVDPLSSELAGTGIPLDREDGVIRLVPGLARANELSDGAIVRLAPIEIDTGGRDESTVVPGFAMRLAELGTGEALTHPSHDSVLLGTQQIPLEDGALRIRWSGDLDSAQDARVIPFFEVFAGNVDPSVFADAIVLVGTVDDGATAFVDTPVGRLPPLLVHANALNTILTDRPVEQGPSALGVAVAVAAAILVVLIPTRRRTWRWLIALAITVGWLLLVRWSWDEGTLQRPLVVPAAVLAAALASETRAQAGALAERRRLRSLFSQYVPATVADQLIASGRGEAASAGERVALTTLFCDLRGFTAVAATLEPARVRDLLNEYYEAMSRVVFDEAGTVLQYTGDEVFAVFGAPLPMAEHPDAALRCARRMFDALPDLNRSLADKDLPPLNFGIGLHSGDVIAAHIGSSIRQQYAVIGDPINVGSRHCSLADAGQIVLSEVTHRLLDRAPFDAERLDGVSLKGVSGHSTAYRIQAGPTAVSGSTALAAEPQAG